jgi:hypothetical protein
MYAEPEGEAEIRLADDWVIRVLWSSEDDVSASCVVAREMGEGHVHVRLDVGQDEEFEEEGGGDDDTQVRRGIARASILVLLFSKSLSMSMPTSIKEDGDLRTCTVVNQFC